MAVVAAVVVAAGFTGRHLKPLRAGNDVRTGSVVPNGSAAIASCSAAASQRKLSELHAASARLASYVLGRVDEFERLKSEAADRAIALEEMHAAYANARSARALAENAVIEYEQGTARQDEAKASGEMFEARQSLERAQNNIQEQKDQFDQLKASSKDAIVVLAASILTKQRLRVAESRQSEAADALTEAESRWRELLEKTKPSRVKDLRATVAKRKSDELELKAKWELEQSKLEQLQKAALEQAPSPLEKRILALLDRAISIEDQIQASLGPLTTEGTTDRRAQQEIRDLTDQLATVVDQAQLEAVAAENARLKPRIHAAADRYPAAALEEPVVARRPIARNDR